MLETAEQEMGGNAVATLFYDRLSTGELPLCSF